MKITKIIATSFKQRTIRNKTALAGNPLTYILHSQNFISEEDIKNLILFNIEQENKSNPGGMLDIIIVNNDVGSEYGNNFIKSLNGKQLKNGTLYTIQNDNIGWSYGAFNKGFQVFKKYYDFFIFTEDDVMIINDNYLKIALDLFNNTNNCGFVSYLGISHSSFGLPFKDSLHANCGTGLTSKLVLETINKSNGCLPHSKFTDISHYKEIIIQGEIAFTNKIYKAGYQLIEISNNLKLFEPAYDKMRGISLPWKPSIYTKYLYLTKKYFRRFIYNFLKMIGLYKFYIFIKSIFKIK